MSSAPSYVPSNPEAVGKSEPFRTRLMSIDVYRGAVMFLMLAEMLHLSKLADVPWENSWLLGLKNWGVWDWVKFSTTHVEWEGCSLHDLIQPSFSFLVGASLPFSIASRFRAGQSIGRMVTHAAWRSVILILLGIFLRSLGEKHHQTYFTFEDTLTQIGLGYTFLFLIGLAKPWFQWLAILAILLGYWSSFVAYPLPSQDFDYAQVGVPDNWPHHHEGLAAHWNKNSNLAWAFDRWFLNLFPRAKPFEFSSGNYSTLSFIPTLATMILGLIAGGWLQRPFNLSQRSYRFLASGLICLALGWLVAQWGWCPIVKRIWTPTWTLWSGGWCLLSLFGFHLICDVGQITRWAFPLLVIGSNSIAAYVIDWTMKDWIESNLRKHLGSRLFSLAGDTMAPFLLGLSALIIIWLMLYWMYRRKIFLRI